MSLLAISQVFLSILDLIGIGLVGLLGAISIHGIESTKPSAKISRFLQIFSLENYRFQNQIAFLGLTAAVIFIFKTMLAIYFNKKVYKFLSAKGAGISSELFEKILNLKLNQINRHSNQEILFMVSDGVKNITNGIVGSSVTLVSDLAMLVILTTGLMVIDPAVALFTIALFLAVGVSLHWLMQVRAEKLGMKAEKLNILNNSIILDVLNSYREVVVKFRRKYFAKKVKFVRQNLGEVNAEISFQPYISKYVIETVAILSACSLASYEFATKNAVHAAAILSVFMAATTRIAPAALRIQQGLLMIKSSTGTAGSTLKMLEDIKSVELPQNQEKEPDFEYPEFIPSIEIREIAFEYHEHRNFKLRNINVSIPKGTKVAIVGPSGSGKTTLVDLILGVLSPDSGYVNISGMKPLDAIAKWPGAISYVPQTIHLTSNTLADNILHGFEVNSNSGRYIWEALEKAQLAKVAKELQLQLETNMGEGSSRLSGGQIQRIGIARALYTRPKLIILDEATSALDGETELAISKAFEGLEGDTTLIIIAHRLSTVTNADLVIYLDGGTILATGKFEEVRKKVPDFDRQAKLMGL